MAVVASRRPVYISGNPVVMGIRARFGVTRCRARKSRVVRGIDMAICAGSSIVRNFELRMAESGAQPGCRGVAGGASCRISGCNVIRHRPAQRPGALPLRGVAAVAIGGRRRRCCMAQIAGHRGMGSGQGKTGGVVIKCCAQPGSCGVARGARRRVAGGNVIRNRSPQGRGALPLCRMTAVAGSCHRCVIVVHVAQGAGDGGVRASEREGCRVVIETRRAPIRRGMADGAVRRKSGGDVVRHRSPQGRGALPGGDVASIASGRAERVVVADVA